MLLLSNQFFFIGYELFQVLEISCEDILQEVVAMEERNIAIMP